MAQRFFKTHPLDGKIFFRATASGRTYLSATLNRGRWIAFSSKLPSLDAVPVTEINKAEYLQLLGLKRVRVITAGGDNFYQNKPSDSWVAASALVVDHSYLHTSVEG